MKSCSNILRLIQTLKGTHVHTHYKMKRERKHIHKTRNWKSWMLMNADTWVLREQMVYPQCDRYVAPHMLREIKSKVNWILRNWSHRFSNNSYECIKWLLILYFVLYPCQAQNSTKLKAISVLSPPANRTGSLLQTLLPLHPHVLKSAEAGEDGASHPGWVFLAGHRQNIDPGVTGCHLQPLREANLPYWPFTAPANWDHAS